MNSDFSHPGNGIKLPDIVNALNDAARKFGQKALAAELDMAPSTLSNKLQAYPSPESRHKLHFAEVDALLEITRDMRPLELLAARHGYLLLPMQANPDAPTLADEMLQDVQDFAMLQQALQSGCVLAVAHALNALIKNLVESKTMMEMKKNK